MLRVEAKFPPSTMPATRIAPKTIESTLRAPLVFSPDTVSPPVSKNPMWWVSPSTPNATRTRPISPAPMR